MEGLLPKNYGDDAVEIPGARALLQELIDRKKPWAIVTSGSMPLVSGVSDSVFIMPGSLFSPSSPLSHYCAFAHLTPRKPLSSAAYLDAVSLK